LLAAHWNLKEVNREYAVQDAVTDIPCIDLTGPLNNYAVAFFVSRGAFTSVMRENCFLDSDLYSKVQDWTLLLQALNMVVTLVLAPKSPLSSALNLLASSFSEFFKKIQYEY
jgi:hypothetical protein